MPKVSYAFKDAVDVSLGIQEGYIEVVNAVTTIHQFPPNKTTGNQSDPGAFVALTVVRNDEKGERLPDAEEITEYLSIGGRDRNTGEFAFRPGKAENGDDNDPEDLGSEVDTEGNCIYVADEGKKLNKKCKWLRFTSSLEAKGFKPEVMARGYMPDLIGLKCHVHTETLPKQPGQENDSTALICDKILVFPYEKKAAGKGTAPKTNGKAAAPKPAPKPAPATQESPATDEAPEESIAVEKLTAVADELAGKDSVERKKVQTMVQAKCMREKVPTKLHTPILNLIKSDEWLTKITGDDGPLFGRMMVDFDSGTVMFAAS